MCWSDSICFRRSDHHDQDRIHHNNYRIGNTNRTLGQASNDVEGFIVLNMCTGDTFVVSGGVWTSGGTFNAALLAAWYGTTVSNAGPGLGYSIGVTDRILGDATPDPEGFLVLNLISNAVFEVSGGVWVDGGVFPSALLAAWQSS